MEYLEAGRTIDKMENWEKMKASLMAQFGLGNQAWIARNQLLDLKHTGKIQAYIKEFTWLMLEIKDMSEEDKLFYFMNGLYPWAQS
jgi:hypothetical protein